MAKQLVYTKGFSRGRAIATAVNQMRRWARGQGGVKADTRIKAAAALASWEAKRARAKANNK